MSYYNTTALVGDSLRESRRKASSQDGIVLEFFEQRAGIAFTPCEVHKQLVEAQQISSLVPLTSIRRTINTLTKEGKLRNTGNRRMGHYGAPNFTWIYDAKTTLF